MAHAKKVRKKPRKPSVRVITPKKAVAAKAVTTRKAGAKPEKKTAKRRTQKKAAKKTAGTCFVLMPFKEPFETYYRGIIRPAVMAVNLESLRGDSLFTPTPIMGDVWDMIQEAKVLVADLTGKNANVFYELGLGHAIGKPIILMVESMDDVPFDLQPLRVILYDKDDPAWGNKLKNALSNALKETLKSPAEGVPPMFRKRVKSQAPTESDTVSRLAALERRVSSLDAGARGTSFGRPIHSTLELEREARALSSREKAVALVLRAMEAGYSRRRIQGIIEPFVPPDELTGIMKEAFGKLL